MDLLYSKLLFLTIFYASLTHTMEQRSAQRKSAIQIVKEGICNADSTEQILDNLRINHNYQQLRKFRDENNNNLIHSAVQELIKKKDDENFNQILKNYKPLLRNFVNCGISVHETNNDSQTPISLCATLPSDPKLAYFAWILKNDLEHFTPKPHGLPRHDTFDIKALIQILFCECLKLKND
jgi:hypothetical protein